MAEGGRVPGIPAPGGVDLESTASLLIQAKGGDAAARERLLQRYMPSLQRWARGRLGAARDLADTDDLVQITLLRALEHMDGFEPRGPGSFLAYLRRILQNQIREEFRRARRRPPIDGLPANLETEERSPLERAIDRESLEAYEAGLARLSGSQQEAVLLRLEMGWSYQEIAVVIGCPSANAARMVVARALVRLAEVIDER
jgi:RNA polymerase sigma-70 factor (ECF subfamily)